MPKRAVELEQALEAAVRRVVGAARVESVRPFGTDVDADDAALTKVAGYGKPLLVRARDAGGAEHALVFHTARADAFGHDRRADRAAEMLLSYDTFSRIPGHAPAVDVGAIGPNGELISLRDTHEFYLLTRYAPGTVYAQELRRIAERGALEPVDVEHMRALADYLVELHSEPVASRTAYRRAIRDLVGSGEGIFGIVDSYDPETPGTTSAQLLSIERHCVDFRWRLRDRYSRLRTIHGDFHPFNLVFDQHSGLHLLDASRGCLGDPADDVACLAINYLFFALCHPGTWAGVFETLWNEFWERYTSRSGDPDLFQVLPPFFAWRALVLASPAWYSGLATEGRKALLGFTERILDASRFAPDGARELFA
jgi:Ser/Thr protein kinase RdoA (MazF antagonist)